MVGLVDHQVTHSLEAQFNTATAVAADLTVGNPEGPDVGTGPPSQQRADLLES